MNKDTLIDAWLVWTELKAELYQGINHLKLRNLEILMSRYEHKKSQ